MMWIFLSTTGKHEDGLVEALGGLLPQGEDYEELAFANHMKKKKKRKKKS